MPGIARKGSDNARGTITGPSSSTVYADGKPVALLGDIVAGHGKAPHSNPKLVSNGAQKVLVDGKIPAKKGTQASCGHSVTPGSSTVIVP
jgi:uncharacterized Zn-binding protein involved in type VI secretion